MSRDGRRSRIQDKYRSCTMVMRMVAGPANASRPQSLCNRSASDMCVFRANVSL